MREELRPVATRNITASLVLGKVAEEEKIEVEDSEIDTQIDSMTTGVADDKKDELRKLMGTPQTRRSIQQQLLTRKAIERLTDTAKSPEATGTEIKEDKK